MARFGDGLAVGPDLVYAAESAVRQAMAPLHGRRPDLVCVFICGEDLDTVEVAGLVAMDVAGARTTLGCGAGGVIGGSRGIEGTSGVSAFAAVLPDVQLKPFHLESRRTDRSVVVTGMPELRADDAVAVLLADPYTFPVDAFVERSNEVMRGLPLIGGIATGSLGEGEARLFVDGRTVNHGAVGVVLGGSVAARPVVSQGCRPVGPSMVVTKSEANILLELAGAPAVTKLEEIVAALPETDRELFATGPQVGIAMNEYAEEHERGDFLIRGVVGVDHEREGVAVGDVVEVGRTVRFQVRDAAAADDDLRGLLAACRDDKEFGPVEGALLFSCNGRGAALFPSPDHDVLAVRRVLGIEGVGGFFAGGEIGPVAGRNHVHGFTASILAFGPQERAQ
ncbi:MAG: FIST signal transduction protein [Streptosporangiaceae bacterium]